MSAELKNTIEQIPYPGRDETLGDLGLVKECKDGEVTIFLPSPAISGEMIEKAIRAEAGEQH